MEMRPCGTRQDRSSSTGAVVAGKPRLMKAAPCKRAETPYIRPCCTPQECPHSASSPPSPAQHLASAPGEVASVKHQRRQDEARTRPPGSPTSPPWVGSYIDLLLLDRYRCTYGSPPPRQGR
ncbi:hypothetical protein U9M48_026136 [Paspalum notatum var. saurae]|uniref:Uncharacterized protein n=1 Tax=Paspalum notatum var. saurae TaxID=547442 RepID=A0AAQ3TS93_PASNO